VHIRPARHRFKTCPVCGAEKLKSEFGFSRNTPDKLGVECSSCRGNKNKPKKVCRRCMEVLPVSEFHSNRAMPDGLDSYCKKCKSETHPEKYIKHTYGLSGSEHSALLEKQRGVCAICRKTEATIHLKKPLRLSIDHDHKTGKARGLLCYLCNHLVGHMERSGMSLVTRALEYLREYGTPLT